MALGNQIKHYRRKAGLTLEALSEISGVDVGTISALEVRDSSRSKYATALATALGLSVEQIEQEGADFPVNPGAHNTLPGPDVHGPYPVLSTVQAGRWTEICGQFQREDAQEWRPSARRLGPNGYMLRVAGQSMYAPGQAYSFPEGMILHVNPDAAPVPGQFVVVRRADSDEATFKRYVLIDGRPFLEAINPDWPKELKYLPLQPDDVWCGVVKDASVGDLP